MTQRLMKPGTWSLRFKASCPRSIYSAPGYFDHIVVVPTRMDPVTGFTDANILANAFYTGVIHTKPDHLSLEGAGPEWWLGTPQGACQWIDPNTRSSSTALALSAWIAVYFPVTFKAIQTGTLNDSGLPLAPANTKIIGPITVREAVDALCQLVGAEWRTTPRMKLDAGLASNLFVTTPSVVVTRHEEGQEGTYRGLAGSELNAAGDVQEYANLVYSSDAAGTNYSALSAATFYDFYGNSLNMMRVVDGGPAGTPAALQKIADTLAVQLAVTRSNVTLSSKTYAIGRTVQPGDYVYAWDQEAGLSDSAVQIPYRGELISPIKLRVYALTWPFAQGMGVYLRDRNATYTDLTDQIEWETSDVQWEVGATARELGGTSNSYGGAYLGQNGTIATRTADTLGVLGVHSLVTAFNTAATHTVVQAEGLTKTVDDIAGRRYKFTLCVNPYAPGGVQGVRYRLYRDGVTMRDWDIPAESISATVDHSVTLTHTDLVATSKVGAVYSIGLGAITANTQVSSYGAAGQHRQLVIEDIGGV